MFLGRSHFQLGDYEKAIETFQNFLSRFPDHELADDAMYSIGDSYYNLGEYDKAIRAYEQMLRQFPESPLVADAISGIQWAMVQKGDKKAAARVTELYADYIRKDETAVDLKKRKAELYLSMGESEKAVQIYQEIIREYPRSEEAASAWFWIAQIYLKDNRRELAEGALLHQISSYPKAPATADALNILADWAMEAKDFAAAERYSTRLQKEFPDSDYAPKAAYRIGLIHLQRDLINDAENTFRRMLETPGSPDYADYAKLGLARVALARKSYADALVYVDEVIQNRSDGLAAEAQFLKGEIYFEQEDYRKAGLEYLKLRYLFESYPFWVVRGLYSAGLCYERLNQITDAIKMYRAILQKFPDSEYAALAQEHLDQITGR